MVALALACAHQPVVTTPPARAPAPARQLPNDVRWLRTAAEYSALARQAFQAAGDRLPALAANLAPQSWAVILDADETILDNIDTPDAMFAAEFVERLHDAKWQQRFAIHRNAIAVLESKIDVFRFVRRIFW